MGLYEKSDKKYFKVSMGAIRASCDKNDPKAKERVIEKTGEKIYERVYTAIDGRLDGITFYSHSEYGNSWNIELSDQGEKFVLQVKEDSRYGIDFLKKLPHLQVGKRYKFMAYDFTKNDVHRVGIAIENDAQEKLTSYYQKFEGEGKDLKVTNLHGYPEFDGDWKDKDDLKIYFTRLAKFLRIKSQEVIKNWQYQVPPDVQEEKEIETKVDAGSDDLPF